MASTPADQSPCDLGIRISSGEDEVLAGDHHVAVADQRDITQAGDAVTAFAVPLLLVLLVTLVVHLARTDALPFGLRLERLRKTSVGVVAALVVLCTGLGALASWKTYDAGHSGAKSAWNDVDLSKLGEDD